MLDIGWTELLIIGVVALVVVGPKDLPKMFRTLGQLTGKARSMAREFQRAMDAAADETGVKDMARDLRDTASGRKFKDEMGFDELDRDMRAMGKPDLWGKDSRKPAKPETVAQRKAREQADGIEAEDDEAMAAAHDADLAARNKKATALDAERLKAADRAAAARAKAAEIRARREAEAASAAQPANPPGPAKPASAGARASAGTTTQPAPASAGRAERSRPASPPRGAAGGAFGEAAEKPLKKPAKKTAKKPADRPQGPEAET